MSNPVILAACRTAGGKFGGSLSGREAPDLGALAIREAVNRSGVKDEDIAEVIMGNGWQAGVGANPARIAVHRAGLPADIPAFTVNKRCGSGLRAIMLASDRIRLGDARVMAAGGMESASRAPYVLPDARWGHRMGDKKALDVLHKDGFLCPLAGMLMGTATEILVEEYDISRKEQEEFALSSHRKALEAIEKGLFAEEVLPVEVKKKKETVTFDTEEIPRADTTLEKLAKLPAIFKEGGTITAGTSSALCDAGSAVVVADPEWAGANGHKPIAEIIGYASGALQADRFGLGPAVATPKALEMAGVALEDIDLIELNEAFAAQAIAVHRVMPFDWDKCNIHGGAIALGHPIGATGSKILTTLVYSLKQTDGELGLATACIGGGQGVAMVVRRL